MAVSAVSACSVILFGTGEHARVIADIARSAGYALVAVVDEDRAKAGIEGIPLYHDARDAAEHHADARWCVSIGDNHTRESVVARLENSLPDVQFARLIHKRATVADGVDIGDGTVVMAGVVINPGTRIGRHCIVNTGACLDHDNLLEDFASVAPGVTSGGKVEIGFATAVCIGACVQHGVRIGQRTVIGAGSVVLGDVPELSVAYGTPCRVVRSRSPADRYL